MGIVRDLSRKDEGIRKIAWAKSFMPVLTEIEKNIEREGTFKGLKIAISVHMEAKTAALALALKKGGAEVYATGCNPLSTQDDIAAGLQSLGVEVFAVRGASAEEYESHLKKTLSCHPNLIIDDGGDFISLLSGECSEFGDGLIGGGEETTTGVRRLRSRMKAGKLLWPMFNVNDAKCKHYYDNKYGTGQSVWDAIMHMTNLLVAGKTVVIAGYGYCGRGIALRAKGLGADVIITEVDPFKALEATMENFRVMPMDDAAKLGDLFISATGCNKVITDRHFKVMKDNAFLANAGHFDVEVDIKSLTEMAEETFLRRENIKGYRMKDGRVLNLLSEGRLVNLAGGNGHPAEIMDLSFSVQTLVLKYLKEHAGLKPGVYEVPEEIDDEIAEIKLKTSGLKIDRLAESQRDYLDGWGS